MNVFERQDKARHFSTRLTTLLIVAVVSVVLSLHAVVAFVAYRLYVGSLSELLAETDLDFLRFLYALLFKSMPVLFVVDVALFGGMILCGYLWKLSSMKRKGITGLVRSIGGRRVKRGDLKMRDRRLYNVVEEIAISTGTPVPRVFILDDEHGINACAVGTTPANMGICVTQGALDRLTRRELQSVVAHEFSHIIHNDVQLNMRTIAALAGVETISRIGFWIVDESLKGLEPHNSDRNVLPYDFAIAAIGGVLVCLGCVGFFFGRLIRAAICRQREYLADASAVRLTLDPDGLVSALKKIGCPRIGSSVGARGSAQMAHLFFSSVYKPGLISDLLQTHPALVKRIRAFEPTFDGKFPRLVEFTSWEMEDEPYSAGYTGGAVSIGTSGGFDRDASPAPSLSEIFEAKKKERAAANAPILADYNAAPAVFYGDWILPQDEPYSKKPRIAPRLLEPLPPEFGRVVGASATARAAVYCALRSVDPKTWQKQREILEREESSDVTSALDDVNELVKPLPATSRLLVLREAVPVLKEANVKDYQRFRGVVDEFCAVNERPDLFTFTVQTSILHELDVFYRLKSEPKPQYSRFSSIAESFTVVMVCLAYEGDRLSETAEKAFASACDVFRFKTDFPKTNEYTLKAFIEALNRLSLSSPKLKRGVFEACWRCILADGVVTERESALLSAITAALGISAPVWKDWA